MKKILIPLLALTLFGFGCGSTPTNTTPVVDPKPETPSPRAEARVVTGAETDSTWKTYTNSALGFSFMWPMKGRYAPEWEVKLFRDTDAVIKDGCFSYEGQAEGAAETVKVGGTVFCHTRGSDNGAGQHYVLDTYATPIGKTIVAIQFSKHTVNAGALNCTMPEPYSVSGTACIPFMEAEYQATLDGIVGTYRKQ